MEADTAQHYAALTAAGVPLRHAHMMDVRQWAYNDWLADAAGAPRLPEWRPAMYAAVGASKRAHPEDYRDRCGRVGQRLCSCRACWLPGGMHGVAMLFCARPCHVHTPWCSSSSTRPQLGCYV